MPYLTAFGKLEQRAITYSEQHKREREREEKNEHLDRQFPGNRITAVRRQVQKNQLCGINSKRSQEMCNEETSDTDMNIYS
jgi:hypothetical protein